MSLKYCCSKVHCLSKVYLFAVSVGLWSVAREIFTKKLSFAAPSATLGHLLLRLPLARRHHGQDEEPAAAQEGRRRGAAAGGPRAGRCCRVGDHRRGAGDLRRRRRPPASPPRDRPHRRLHSQDERRRHLPGPGRPAAAGVRPRQGPGHGREPRELGVRRRQQRRQLWRREFVFI
jgi:hypothetical protein